MKIQFLLLSALLAVGTLHAQFYKDKEKVTGFSKVVEQVLLDFPYNYKNISGDFIIAQGQFEHYSSLVVPPGAEEAVIARYHSGLDTTANWQAILLRHEDYEEIEKAYQKFYHQLKRTIIHAVDGSPFQLVGAYTTPSTANDFTITTMKLQSGDRRYKHLKVELELLYKMNEWHINLNVVTRKPDEDLRPDWWGTSSGND